MPSDSESPTRQEREKHHKHSRKDKDKKKHKSKSKKEKKDKSAKKSHHNKRSHSDRGSDSDSVSSDSGGESRAHKKKSSKKDISSVTAWMHDDSDLRQPAKPANTNQPTHQHQPDVVERKASVDSIPKQRRPSVSSSRKSSVMAPQRPEEHVAEMNKLRRELDPMTGRIRLIKGTGEVVEEIVTKKQHVEINQQATRGDGAAYSSILHSLVRE
ncbi:nuclear RNA-splicing-associated protein-domain-containing protein [Chytriomyces cf. hyalinus JEL632]|nr:nuclear RNA-splicing-associated protein-domain-containing protein [Chytriomyces cf. hyalinus JEL632]